jgi:hypothetical protein
MIGFSNALYPSTFSSLEVHVGPAQFFIGGELFVVAPSVIFVEPNSTSYLYFSFSGGTVGITRMFYPTDDLPICVAVTDSEKVIGLQDDRPDFTNGVPGVVTPNFSDAEVPSGAINGTNTEFSLASSPTPAASLILMLNGLVQAQGADYTLLNQEITFAIPPVTGDALLAFYRY